VQARSSTRVIARRGVKPRRGNPFSKGSLAFPRYAPSVLSVGNGYHPFRNAGTAFSRHAPSVLSVGNGYHPFRNAGTAFPRHAPSVLSVGNGYHPFRNAGTAFPRYAPSVLSVGNGYHPFRNAVFLQFPKKSQILCNLHSILWAERHTLHNILYKILRIFWAPPLTTAPP